VYHNQPSGGARRALYELGRNLSRNHEIDVYTLETADERFLSSGDFARKVEVRPFKRRSPLRFGLYLNEIREHLDLGDLEGVCRSIASEIDSQLYDVVLVDACRFTQAPSVLAYLSTPTAYYCHEPPRRFIDPSCRPESAPLSLYERARIAWHRPARFFYDKQTAKLDRRNVARANVVLTNSEHNRGTIKRYYGRDALVCHLGVDSDRFVPNGATPSDYVLSVGALEPHKGFDFLVRAVARCPVDSRPRLTIVGNTDAAGVGRHLRRLARDAAVELDIRVRIADEELVRLYQGAQAFVYAPHSEPFGLVVLEAMACGVPVVAVDEGGPRESVVDGVTGLLAARQERTFADALMRVLSDRSFAATLGAQARHQVERKWTWEAAANRVEAELARIVSGKVAVA
ncbi:MAG: glycosyltransferase family 4 protein, partial [Dehalococcoidia bacterium]